MQLTVPGEADERKLMIEQAVEAVKAGNKQSYETIIKLFERQMYTYCFYILKNHTETEDAVQEIFIRAYANLHRYSSRTSFSAWIYKLAYHHLMNLKHKKGRWLRLIEHYKEQQRQQQVPLTDSITQELLIYLTIEERHILLLKAVEQYTFEEIGGIMGIGAATVRKKYERLRKKLIERADQKGARVHGTISGANKPF
ncbi:DNA-directed RNA polymerase subunit sigma [Paenibacillus sp. FSL R7-0273]|uniref:RNA polymerase sigma factor n=1 Tax=Paenibacillus sp. FSL R7-0273 TaxID=1536772 RepID=UPI0004F86043|nr:sigma-70 family RNA polymerase sigma factor [Paenibacillus sp. FSL R7-0273]AIQ48271.1 DNA-directed RNA polymerase subunit sigma [Paenibacillus sp. FSL R7-0273]OMF86924.1 RNA polymerase subunit sigma [Paenibacillus sp. FSL R7-0273]